MTDFLNPLGGRFIGRSGPVAPTTITGTIPDPPRGFLQLDPGTIIKGVVMGRENDGLVVIATDKGTVRVASNAPLPPGTHVTLEVRPTGDRLQVLILASDAVRTGAPGQQQLLTPTTNPSIPAPPSAGPSQPPAGSTTPSTSTAPAGTSPTGTAPTGTPAAGAPPTHTAPPPAANQPPPTTTPIQIVGSTLPAIVLQPQSAVPQIPPAPIPGTPPASAPPTPPTASPPPAGVPPASAPPAPPATPPASASPTSAPPASAQPASAPPASIPATSIPATSAPPTSVPPTSTLPTSTPLPSTPPTGAPPAAAPTNSAPPGAAPPPQFQVQLPNGQIITLPVTTTNPALVPAPQPALPVQVQPLQIQPAQIQPAQIQPAQIQPAPPSPLPGMTPVSAPPAQLPLPHEPAPVARPPMITPPPTASTLSGDVQQRILALFTASPAPAATLPPPAHAAISPVAAAAAPPLPPGAELQLRVLAVQIGNQHPIEIDPAAQLGQNGKESQIVFGRVIAVTPAGHAVIQTPVGNILLQQRSSLPMGAQLALAIDTIEAPSAAPAVAAAMAVQTPQQALLSLSRSWPTLADLIAILQGSAPHAAGKGGIDPALARDLLAQLPQMGSRLGAGMLAGIAAFRSGDIGRLLGPLFAARGLGPEREEMVRRLRGEFTQLSSLAQDRPEAEWRALFLPYLDDRQQVQRINLFYRRHRKGESGHADGDGGTRFVVEAAFTRLGPFQLDGLMRRHRFDLMIRSQQRLDERMRRDIEAIYEEARGLTGFSGAIAFQTVDEFPVSPLEELKQQADRVSL